VLLWPRPLRLKLPISRAMIVDLLKSRPPSTSGVRDKLHTVVATLACLRTYEAAALQLCGVLFDFHTSRLRLEFRGTAALRIIRRKDDPQRKGRHPVLGRSIDVGLDAVHQLKAWFGNDGRSVSPQCTKGRAPGARCSFCGPLFPRCTAAYGGGVRLTSVHLSPQGARKPSRGPCFRSACGLSHVFWYQRAGGGIIPGDGGGRAGGGHLPAERPWTGTLRQRIHAPSRPGSSQPDL
jgi:hypothetical protein